MTEIDVDLDACIDTTLLQEKLHGCAREGQGVYAGLSPLSAQQKKVLWRGSVRF
jgi:hypothetical protein